MSRDPLSPTNQRPPESVAHSRPFSYVRRRRERVVDAGRSMQHTSRLAITLAALGVLSGCAILEPRAKEDLSGGYALLYDLASKEKQSSQLSIIKTISPELKSLLERISETSKVTGKELETLARINPPLNLEVSHLPTIERAARDSIDKETTKQILRSTGVDLEFNMVSSQLAAMNYAAHLARSLAVVETNPRRKEFLQRTDRKFSDLHGHVYKILFTRYQR
jgi:hypothetical protein